MRARSKWLLLVFFLIIFQGFVYQQFLVLTESGLRVIFSSGSFGDLVWVCLAILLIFRFVRLQVSLFQQFQQNYLLQHSMNFGGI